jgi:hypothetical protein
LPCQYAMQHYNGADADSSLICDEYSLRKSGNIVVCAVLNSAANTVRRSP